MAEIRTAPVHVDSLPAESGGGYPEPFQSAVGLIRDSRSF
jgi:hypothetical protein